MNEDFRLFHVAKLYYIDHVKQTEIAEMLGISKMLVSRILKRAEEEKIVTFQVKSPEMLDWDAGIKIKKKFPMLKEALVVQVNPMDNGRQRIGRVAAEYVSSILTQQSILGISWGRTICEFAKAMHGLSFPKVKIVQISGGFLYENDMMMMPSNLVRLVSERLQGEPIFLNAPLYVPNQETRQVLMRDPMCLYIRRLIEQCQITVYGVSSINDTSTTMQVGVLNREDITELHTKGAIGDVMGFYIDKDGELLDWSKKDCIVSMSLDMVSNATHAICLANEIEKADVLKKAIEKKYCNTIILSGSLAELLLKN
jgi:deoxyribonucleoside regulator